MKIGLVGWGIETQSAYRYFGNTNQYLIVNEQPIANPPVGDNIQIQVLDSVKSTGDAGSINDLSYLNGIEDCDKIIYSPVAWNNLLRYSENNNGILQKSCTVMHIFFEKVDKKKIIGITGTKGKTTTATLIYEFLRSAGRNVFIGGNIGNSPLDFIDSMSKEDAIAVLELSSYQLNSLTTSPHIAVLLSITPEHLDWHGNFENYTTAKENIAKFQDENDHLIFSVKNEIANNIAMKHLAIKHPFPSDHKPFKIVKKEMIFSSGQIINIEELDLRGEHNMLNIEAACTVYKLLEDDTAPVVRALKEFKALPHRLSYVCEVEGVRFYDDSIASTPEAALAGFSTFGEKVVLLLGGHDRGLELHSFGQELFKKIDNIRHIVCFGEVGKKLSEMLSGLGIMNTLVDDRDMGIVVKTAWSNAKTGDIILLSPGFSSYDMYRKFDERGDDFCKNVSVLAQEIRGAK